MGLVDDRILQKIRREIDDPEKNVKPKAILSFLVKREQITKGQATKLLSEMEKAVEEPVEIVEEVVAAPVEVLEEVAVAVDEIEVSQPQEYDTGDLTNLSPEEVVEVNVDATQLDMGSPAEVVEEIVEVAVEEEPVYTPDEVVEEIVEPVAQPAAPAYQADPMGAAAMMGDPLAGGFNDPNAKPEEPEPSKTLGGFQGKRDSKDQWATKWLYIGFGLLGFLLIMGAVLYLAVGGQSIEKLQIVAEESFQRRAYMDAMKKFEELIEMSPRHENVSTWKVRRVHSMLAQPWEASNYSEVLKLSKEHLPDISEEVAFADLQGDLALFLPGSGLAITDIAKELDMGFDPKEGIAKTEHLSKLLVRAESAQAVVNDSRFLTGTDKKRDTVQRQIFEIDDNVRRIQEAITKEQDYAKVKVTIGELTDSGKTDEAFRQYNVIVRKYPDLGTRGELRGLMKNVSVKEIELVEPGGVDIAGAADDAASLVESQVVVARREGNPVSSLKGEVLPVLADGVLYGVDVGDGTVLWNRFMGFETAYEPQWADPENHDELIISDQRNQQILKIKARDGSLVWRAEIGQDFCNPTVVAEKIYVTTYSGLIIGLNSQTGNSFASSQLRQGTQISATASSRYPLVYQLGENSNMYVLSQDDLTCKEVVYLGHAKGSISAPVYEWGAYLLVAVNGADYCDVQVLKQSKEEGVEEGLGLYRTQLVQKVTTGHVTSPLLRMGRRLLAVSDTGNLSLLEKNNIDNEDAPINPVSKQDFEVRKGDRVYVYAEGSRLWIASKGVMQYRLSAVNEFKRKPVDNPDDFFLGPIERFDSTLVHVRRRANSAMTSISAVNEDSMSEIWRTDLGAAFSGAPLLNEGKVQVVSSQGDLFQVDEAAQRVGYIDRGVWSADVAENFQFDQSVKLNDGSYLCVGPNRDILWVQPDGTTTLGRLQNRFDKPACPIIGFGNSVIVASKNGPVGIMDPENGRSRGNPFQPPKVADKDTLWTTPTVLSNTQVAIGDEDGQLYLLNTDGRAFELTSQLELEGPLKSGLVSQAGVAYGVVETGAGPFLTAWNTDGGLAAAAKTELDGNLVHGPWLAGETIMFTDDQGRMVAYPLDLSAKRWSMSVGNDTLAGQPIVSGSSVLLTMASGVMKVLDLSSGEVQKEVDFGQPVMHEPLFTADKVYVGGADGRLLVLPRSAF
jgi:outer membrane protein assembly factor BamB